MLGNLCIPHYSSIRVRLTPRKGSDNVSGAENQQERPGFEQWVVGFVDGEGCFSAPIYRNPTYRIGWQVQPAFAVVQGEKSVCVLHELKAFFGCGAVPFFEKKPSENGES
jgi:hypothetical protein